MLDKFKQIPVSNKNSRIKVCTEQSTGTSYERYKND